MAIEKRGGGYSGGNFPGDGEMPQDESHQDDMPAEDGETAEIPLSMVMDGQPGDVVRLTIVSRNDDSGTATVKYADEPKMGNSIKEAAAQFEE